MSIGSLGQWLPDDNSRPLGHGNVGFQDLSFDVMVNMRRVHQTKQAANGTRTRKVKATESTTRTRILKEFHQALREAQEDRGVGSGNDRGARWRQRQAAPGGRDAVIDGVSAPAPVAGNEANAAVVAAKAAKQAETRRKNIFMKAKVPLLSELVSARVTPIRPLQIGDYGFVSTATDGLMVGKVVAFFSKSGGKNGKHCDVTESSKITAVSNIAVQLFQWRGHGQVFRDVPHKTAAFLTRQFVLVPSIQFLCLLDSNFPSDHDLSYIELKPSDMERFHRLQASKTQLLEAIKISKKRGGGLDLDE